MLNLRKGSTGQELRGLLGVAVTAQAPTRAAFSKARQGLSEKVFSYLNGLAIQRFCAGWSTPLWHGFRLRAVDGTTFRLPPAKALASAFGVQDNGPADAGAWIDPLRHRA